MRRDRQYWGNDRDTNVVKLTRLLLNDHLQILFYDPGVGTNDTYPSIGYWSRFTTRAKELMALAGGGGIYENIGQAYEFLVEHFGWGIFLSNILAFVCLPLFILYMNRFQIESEERTLASLFGEAFAAYRSRVRRWL